MVAVTQNEVREAILDAIKRRGLSTWYGYRPVLINWLKNDIFAHDQIRLTHEEAISVVDEMLAERLPPIYFSEEDEHGKVRLGLTVVKANLELLVARAKYVLTTPMNTQPPPPPEEVYKMFPGADWVEPVIEKEAAA
jgi:hypothetical protein